MYIFICEDSLDGILTGIYDAWSFKIQHGDLSHDDIHLTSCEPDNYELFSNYFPVNTSLEKAQKVSHTIWNKLGGEFYEAIVKAALSREPIKQKDMDKADAIYKTVVLALCSPEAEKVLLYLGIPCIYRVFALSRATNTEAHHLMGFLRFSELKNGVLFSTIHPKNHALPILAEHFSDRFPQENFMIFDETRNLAAVHSAGKNYMLVDASDLNQDIIHNYSEEEQQFRDLWLTFFDSIAIEARVNPKLQAQNIPKRYWPDTLEFAR